MLRFWVCVVLISSGFNLAPADSKEIFDYSYDIDNFQDDLYGPFSMESSSEEENDKKVENEIETYLKPDNDDADTGPLHDYQIEDNRSDNKREPDENHYEALNNGMILEDAADQSQSEENKSDETSKARDTFENDLYETFKQEADNSDADTINSDSQQNNSDEKLDLGISANNQEENLNNKESTEDKSVDSTNGSDENIELFQAEDFNDENRSDDSDNTNHSTEDEEESYDDTFQLYPDNVDKDKSEGGQIDKNENDMNQIDDIENQSNEGEKPIESESSDESLTHDDNDDEESFNGNNFDENIEQAVSIENNQNDESDENEWNEKFELYAPNSEENMNVNNANEQTENQTDEDESEESLVLVAQIFPELKENLKELSKTQQNLEEETVSKSEEDNDAAYSEEEIKGENYILQLRKDTFDDYPVGMDSGNDYDSNDYQDAKKNYFPSDDTFDADDNGPDTAQVDYESDENESIKNDESAKSEEDSNDYQDADAIDENKNYVPSDDIFDADDNGPDTAQVDYESDENESFEKDESAKSEEDASDLNSKMVQFTIKHADEFVVDTSSVADATVLSADENTIVTSPNYPDNYPADSYVDWSFYGDGTGVEMNITDFSINGNAGDYLLVKPGGLESNSNNNASQLIFSYELETEQGQKNYRFLDINKIFMRFKANPSDGGFRGFRISMRLIHPAEEQSSTELPTVAPLVDSLPPHHNTHLVFLGGVTPVQFVNISEEFRMFIADMATFYSHTNGIDIGEQSTSEVTFIVSTAACHLSWPGFEQCTAVRFRVGVTEDEALNGEQLADMWDSLVVQDPFASALARMGVEEFIAPNERAALTMWVLVAGAGVVAAVLLAMAAWRYSCYKDYSRMPAYSDTESVCGEKRRPLELYPTPHQNLPPLYDRDYAKFDDTTRVDMGGFTNQGYARDLFTFDSDDEVGSIPNSKRPIDRPKDISQA